MSRIVLLTGAAGGLGRVMMEVLLKDGHSVAAVDRDATGLKRAQEAAGAAMERRLHAIVADLSTEKGCSHAIDAAHARFGAVDALINNAGIGMSAIRPDAEALHPGI